MSGAGGISVGNIYYFARVFCRGTAGSRVAVGGRLAGDSDEGRDAADDSTGRLAGQQGGWRQHWGCLSYCQGELAGGGMG